ncbi:hypothetical protein O181_002084 [Austropuccinia psidii MF-1]|uniref:Uncharacterized protein n=1 Tax=Austropuccinia psidii MF-1 TaxID=1389203 RepID=A0A9Q3GCI4_9BASI|nr:hypothetical protein [Austropuccinia psidii MF-1]
MVTSLLDRSEVIIRPMRDGDGKRKFDLGLIITMSCHPWDSNAKNPLNPPRQDSPVPCMPREQTPQQPIPVPSGTQWSEDLSHENSQHNEPPIPGPSSSSEPPEDIPTCEPEPEVIIIDDMPVRSPTPPPSPCVPPPIASNNPTASSPPVPSSSHSYDDACQEFTNLQPTLMIPQAINQILLEHHRLLHMIPFVDATH